MEHLSTIDLCFIFGFFALALSIGIAVSRKSGKSEAEYFLGGRSMPWWLLGFSMVATTFSTDTPNLVTDIVRKNGIAGNWVWWAFLLTGMLTVFVYARLWRRSGVVTDVEFYELRYSGKPAAFLRGFRAVYLGLFFNIMVMAGVSLAAMKIGATMFGLPPFQSVFWAMLVTVIFSAIGGFRGVLLTDFFLFIMAMVGAFAAAYYALGQPEVGGLSGMLDKFQSNPELSSKLSFLPAFSNTELFISVLIIPLAVQWWAAWYPGAEPGGGGYLAQRMLAAKNEKHAVGATLFFNAAHYALRPWPWIIVALCSLLVFPSDSLDAQKEAEKRLKSAEMVALIKKEDKTPEEEDLIRSLTAQKLGVSSLANEFPKENLPTDKLGHDVGYSAMLTFLPGGWRGLVLASLIAAFMSTISTHLNWGSSYLVNDFYKRFIKKEATQREMVWAGRLSTVVLMILTAVMALLLSNALQLFKILLSIGAGTGALFILRWFWWRINAFSEITAMVVSFLVAVYFQLIHPNAFPKAELPDWLTLIYGVVITTIAWIAVTLVTRPTDPRVLRSFCNKINPGGPGWSRVLSEAAADGEPIEPKHAAQNLPLGILCMFLGCVGVYAALFSTGYFIYRNYVAGSVLAAVATVSAIVLLVLWNRISGDEPAADAGE